MSALVMTFSESTTQFFLALLVLLAVHSAVSYAAFRWLTKTTLIQEQETANEPAIDITTLEQEARGEKVFSMPTKTEVYSQSIPIPVVWYMWGGYAGLAIALLIGIIAWIRHGQV